MLTFSFSIFVHRRCCSVNGSVLFSCSAAHNRTPGALARALGKVELFSFLKFNAINAKRFALLVIAKATLGCNTAAGKRSRGSLREENALQILI